MPSPREYPERPIVGVGGVLIESGKALLIRRGSEPLLGQWSIPGGTLELGETLLEGVVFLGDAFQAAAGHQGGAYAGEPPEQRADVLRPFDHQRHE